MSYTCATFAAHGFPGNHTTHHSPLSVSALHACLFSHNTTHPVRLVSCQYVYPPFPVSSSTSSFSSSSFTFPPQSFETEPRTSASVQKNSSLDNSHHKPSALSISDIEDEDVVRIMGSVGSVSAGLVFGGPQGRPATYHGRGMESKGSPSTFASAGTMGIGGMGRFGGKASPPAGVKLGGFAYQDAYSSLSQSERLLAEAPRMMNNVSTPTAQRIARDTAQSTGSRWGNNL